MNAIKRWWNKRPERRPFTVRGTASSFDEIVELTQNELALNADGVLKLTIKYDRDRKVWGYKVKVRPTNPLPFVLEALARSPQGADIEALSGKTFVFRKPRSE